MGRTRRSRGGHADGRSRRGSPLPQAERNSRHPCRRLGRAATLSFCVEGCFSNLVRKLWGAHRARSSRLGQTANGVGKISGPQPALIAGTGNIVSPKATRHRGA